MGAQGRAFLESLQQNTMLDNEPSRGALDPRLLAAAAQLLAKQPGLREDFEPTQRELPTRFQNPGDFAILNVLLDRLDAAAHRTGFPAPDKTTFGTLALGWFGAETMPVPDSDETAIVFQEGSFTLIQLLAHCVVRAMGVTVENDRTSLNMAWEAIEQHLATDGEPAQRLAEGLVAYAIWGDALYARLDPIGASYALPVRAMLLSADMFVVGHEYAHVLLGHAAQSVARSVAGSDVQAIKRSHLQEFEADALGMRISTSTMSYTTRFDAAISYWGIALLLSGLDLVDRTISTIATGTTRSQMESRTHPPLAERRAMADESLRHLMGAEAAQAPLEVAATIEHIVETLWTQIAPRMLALHTAGMPLARIWVKRGFEVT